MTVSDGQSHPNQSDATEPRAAENSTRRRIIDAAMASILETGFYRASSNEIARRAGVTWGAIQRQFGTREALMLAAFEAEWQRLLDTMGARIEGGTTEARVQSLFTLLKSHYSRPEYFAAVQIITNLRQDPRTTQATLDLIEQMSRKSSGMLPKLLRQLLPGADFDSAVTNTLFFTIRDFFIGLHVESATTLAETYQRRLDRLDAEEDVLIRYLVALVQSQTGTVEFAPEQTPTTTRSSPRCSRGRRDAVSRADIGRRILDFAVAKVSPRPGGGLQITYLCDAGETGQAVVTGIDSPLCAGAHVAVMAMDADSVDVELDIRRRGNVVDLTAGLCGITAHGMGIVDPEFPDSLLVSWSWGNEAPTGIVKYVIADEPHTITATYTSAVLAAEGFDDVKTGHATGFTADGFPGVYSIIYEGVGTDYGPFTWTVVERSSTLELTWDTGTRRAMEGFGFRDPDSTRSIVAAYWSTGPRPTEPRPH